LEEPERMAPKRAACLGDVLKITRARDTIRPPKPRNPVVAPAPSPSPELYSFLLLKLKGNPGNVHMKKMFSGDGSGSGASRKVQNVT
jgi:hypothetical protein